LKQLPFYAAQTARLTAKKSHHIPTISPVRGCTGLLGGVIKEDLDLFSVACAGCAAAGPDTSLSAVVLQPLQLASNIH
jgi:hypothetical protein